PPQGVVYDQRNGQNAAPFRVGDRMHRVLVLGAGKIGALISGLLADAGDYQVALADVNIDEATALPRGRARPWAAQPDRARARRLRRVGAGAPPRGASLRRRDLVPALLLQPRR